MSDTHSQESPSPAADAADEHGGHSGHIRALLTVYVVLMILLAATVGASFINLGGYFNIILAMLIACTKAAMVIWIFMHVKQGGRLVWFFATAAFIWLGIMFIYTFADYGTRSRLPRAEDQLQPAPREHSDVRHGPEARPDNTK